MFEFKKMKVIFSDFEREIEEKIIDYLEQQGLLKESQSNIAERIKNHFDKNFGKTWHCIVGKIFGASITFERKNCIYFSEGELNILLFKVLPL